MKVLPAALLMGFAIPAFAVPVPEDQAPMMAAAANGFYTIYKSLGLSDGIPGASARARIAPLLSPALDALLDTAGAAQNRYAAANKDSPPLIEGDLFTSLFEGASTFKIGACKGDAAHGTCAVLLEYSTPKQKPQDWTDTVFLVNTPQGWRVDDIGYGGNWDFANQGRLTETLKIVLAEAR